jgi:hypothetical protein
MEFVRIKYTGWKPYTDRTPLKTAWAPGDTKPIPAQYAKPLLRFAEFKVSEETAPAPEQEQAMAEAATLAVEQEQDDEHQQMESMLLHVESMDKDTLEAYAEKYETKLDKRLGVAKLRAEVANLIEQFGVR